MAQGISLLLLCCAALQLASGQMLPESVFKVLSAQELRDINLRQNPELLLLAARTGETVTIEITSASQGGVVQEDVNTILDCTPWLQNFPGGTVRWYRYRFTDLDHTMLDMRTEQIPEILNAAEIERASITGEYNQIYTIVRGLISVDAEDSSRGVYECEVCIARGIGVFEVCHSANTTVANVGRPPIIDCGTGRDPASTSPSGNLVTYNIGSTICLNIDQSDPNRNRPLQLARLQCADVGAVEEENIPSAIPSALVTWEHTSLDGTTAFFAINTSPDNIDEATYIPPEEFTMAFPGLIGADSPFTVSTDSTNALDFSVANITRNLSREDYLNLRMAFGFWTCTLNNSLGSQTKTSFISDTCGDFVPSIERNCENIGELFGTFYLVDSQTSVPVRAGCDVCVDPDKALALTLTCPTNIAAFENASITGYEWTGESGALLSVSPSLTVVEPGSYTCRVFFGDDGSDAATSIVGFAPDVEIRAIRMRGGSVFTSSGCERLRYTDPNVKEGDICAFISRELALSDQVIISCDPSAIATPSVTEVRASMDTNGTVAECQVTSDDPNIVVECAGVTELTIHTYEPATIVVDMEDGSDVCVASAGEFYRTVMVPTGAINAVLCCQVLGFPPPEKSWSRIVQQPNGLVVEELLNITGNPRYMLDPSTNRLTILNYDPTIDDGTYVCRAENIAGIDVAIVAISDTAFDPNWRASEWCDCEPFCQGGNRSRSVWCENNLDGTVIADTFCNCPERPAEAEACTDVPGLDLCYLTPLWKTGEFSRCSKGCSGGVRYRAVYCAILRDGTRVHDSDCVERYGADSKPPSYDVCFNTCCVTDEYPPYCYATGSGPCDNPIYQQHCCWTCGLSERG